jgi:hypothetical protein
MGTSKFVILVPLFDLKSLGSFRRLRCRDFKSPALCALKILGRAYGMCGTDERVFRQAGFMAVIAQTAPTRRRLSQWRACDVQDYWARNQENQQNSAGGRLFDCFKQGQSRERNKSRQR